MWHRCCSDRKTACGVAEEASAMCEDPSTFVDLSRDKDMLGCGDIAHLYNSNQQQCDVDVPCYRADGNCNEETVGQRLIEHTRCCSGQATACGPSSGPTSALTTSPTSTPTTLLTSSSGSSTVNVPLAGEKLLLISASLT